MRCCLKNKSDSKEIWFNTEYHLDIKHDKSVTVIEFWKINDIRSMFSKTEIYFSHKIKNSDFRMMVIDDTVFIQLSCEMIEPINKKLKESGIETKIEVNDD